VIAAKPLLIVATLLPFVIAGLDPAISIRRAPRRSIMLLQFSRARLSLRDPKRDGRVKARP
jgi:hypothetical protein